MKNLQPKNKRQWYEYYYELLRRTDGRFPTRTGLEKGDSALANAYQSWLMSRMEFSGWTSLHLQVWFEHKQSPFTQEIPF